MKSGDIFYARTHAELLNQILGTDYKQYMKCAYNLSDDTVIWMIRLDGHESKAGWTNILRADGIYEVYTGDPCSRLDAHKTPNYPKKRLVFDIVESAYQGRRYIFRGIYKFDDIAGDNDRRVWRKISDKY